MFDAIALFQVDRKLHVCNSWKHCKKRFVLTEEKHSACDSLMVAEPNQSSQLQSCCTCWVCPSCTLWAKSTTMHSSFARVFLCINLCSWSQIDPDFILENIFLSRDFSLSCEDWYTDFDAGHSNKITSTWDHSMEKKTRPSTRDTELLETLVLGIELQRIHHWQRQHSSINIFDM